MIPSPQVEVVISTPASKSPAPSQFLSPDQILEKLVSKYLNKGAQTPPSDIITIIGQCNQKVKSEKFIPTPVTKSPLVIRSRFEGAPVLIESSNSEGEEPIKTKKENKSNFIKRPVEDANTRIAIKTETQVLPKFRSLNQFHLNGDENGYGYISISSDSDTGPSHSDQFQTKWAEKRRITPNPPLLKNVKVEQESKSTIALRVSLSPASGSSSSEKSDSVGSPDTEFQGWVFPNKLN